MAAKVETTSDNVQVTVNQSRFCLPKPRSLGKFIIYPSRWALPNFKHLDVLIRRIKTNLLYFQTNYLILSFALFGATT